ncbi:uncharacterized GTP-binding protein C428.15-like [Acropora millepora]|uniref:uncharacterized GTP-binding protein C428.15-like n=1 Tax=Acropora millepora TaxID=45264 RepID=UPI001CF5F787|nr:uncharacterized GTP-binding protein C428.15-like [Acropora millepora]
MDLCNWLDRRRRSCGCVVLALDLKSANPQFKSAQSISWIFPGKPSAGKSTFFNAATHQTTAKIGAHPFTTIEPNIGQALYAIPCPCLHWNQRCDAEYGHSALGERLVPVLLKDVAGLVPGAV